MKCGVRVFTGCATGRFPTSRFSVVAASLGTSVAVFRSSAGSEGCSFLSCFISVNATFLHVMLLGTVSLCSVLKKTRSYSA